MFYHGTGEQRVFVFGSNEAGHHGAGAAQFAHQTLEFPMFKGFGYSSYAFAIPTKDWNVNILALKDISFYVQRFLDYVKSWSNSFPGRVFYVTQIGCGLAGYTPEDIAPMFKDAVELKNVYLPQSFWDVLNK